MKRNLSWVLFVLLFSTIAIGNNKDVSPEKTTSSVNEKTLDKIYSEAYIMNSFASELYLMKGISRIKEQNYELALADFYQALQLNPASHEAHLLIGETMAAKNLQTEALVAFDKAIDLNPFYGEAYLRRANVYQKIGNFQEAYTNYSLAVYLEPSFINSLTNNNTDVLPFSNFSKSNHELKALQK
jgi:tetratricopeptide (TPR) repeat protein